MIGLKVVLDMPIEHANSVADVALARVGDHAATEDRPTLCFPLAGDSLGGSHNSLLGLLRQLDPGKYRILVVVEQPGGKLSKVFAEFTQLADPAAPRKTFAAGKPLGLLKFVTTFKGMLARARFLREHDVRIVHTNDGRSHATWTLPAKLAGARLLWHHRADPKARGLNYLAPWVADQIVSVSRFSLPPGKKSGSLRSAEVVFSPFDTDLAVDRETQRFRLRSELALADDVFILGFFGNLIERKRPLMFVEAIARLQPLTTRPVCGVIFGEAEDPTIEREIRRRISRLGLCEQVQLMGYRSPGAEWIAACDVLAVPAVGEPLGRTLVEAMVVGTPVVATRSGGNTEALLDGLGILVAPDDPSAMAKACAQVAEQSSDLAGMVEQARISAKMRFTRTEHLRTIEQIYCRLLTT